MDSSTGSELIVTLAWRSAQVAALASALMLVIALTVRAHLRREERLRERVISAWRPLLTRVAIEEDEVPALPALRQRELPFVIEEWNALHDAVRGTSSQRLNAVAPGLGLDVAARRGLRSRNITARILAIRTVGHLHDEASWKGLQDQLGSANALVSFYAAAALVQIDAQRAMPGIMLQLAERESWPGEAMARLLVDAGADIAREPIRAMMLSLAADKVPPLLPWLSHVDAVLGSEVAVELMNRHAGHAGITAAALLVVLDPALLPGLAHHAKSGDAEIRKNFAQLCGQLGDLGQADLLVQLMSDTVWWVRYRAAHALLKLKGMDDERLDGIRSSLDDRYARDMLDQARAEAGVE